jgi:hypothetical protein
MKVETLDNQVTLKKLISENLSTHEISLFSQVTPSTSGERKLPPPRTARGKSSGASTERFK